MRIKQKYVIDFSKSVTWIVVLGLICCFNKQESIFHQDNITAWIYFCLHGSYGIMWVMKSNIFPDKSWEEKANLPYAIFMLVCLMAYWSPAFIITTQGTGFHIASPQVIVASIIIFIFGVFYHFVSDMQKHIFLKHNSGLMTEGLWKHCRHPNYFGELLIYTGFLLLTIESSLWWVPILILGAFVLSVWIPGMIRIDKSLSRFEEHKEYKKKTAFIIPFIF